MVSDEAAYDGQTESRALWLCRVEAAERARDFLRCHSTSCVGDADAHDVIALLGGNRDGAAVRREALKAVRDEVVEDSPKRDRIAQHGLHPGLQMYVDRRGVGVACSSHDVLHN